ncbi:FAD-binding oxidoreductase [Candidatus Pacearchaeota archaeon]|nr:FAD-binding oxidoreductase [Candidatus Pacearchaeota archaeon]
MAIKHEVFWRNPSYKGYSKLNKDIECDYLIVGGGISGVSLAYFLSKFKAGKVVLIEKNQIASGATGRAAGILSIRGEADFHDFVKRLGRKNAIIYWDEIHKTLKLLRKIIEEEKIDCDAELEDTLYCGFKHKAYNDIKEEYSYEEVENDSKMLMGEFLKKEINTNLYNHALLSKDHGLSVNPLKLTQNLSLIAKKYGALIYENTRFFGHEKNVARTNGGKIKFKKIIIAIDAQHPSQEILRMKTSLIVTRPLTKEESLITGLVKKKIFHTSSYKKKIFWDNKENYEYGKLTKDNRLLLGFGWVRINKDAEDKLHLPHIAKIRTFLKKLFPYLDLDIEYAWSGSFGVTKNYEPLIKSKGNNLFIAGAATQPGCVMASHYLAHKLTNKKSSLDKIFKLK